MEHLGVQKYLRYYKLLVSWPVLTLRAQKITHVICILSVLPYISCKQNTKESEALFWSVPY